MPTKNAILHVLSGIDDPELKKPLTELDMVRFINIEGGNVTVGITLTVPGCPLRERIYEDVIKGVSSIPDVESVKVEFDVMTDQQREQLRQKLGYSQQADQAPAAGQDFADRFIAVSSGKGGVGKSIITANLVAALARLGQRVGLLDADVYGFSIPRMLGIKGQPTAIDNKIIPLRKGDNIQVISMGFFVKEDEPVIWRGPLLHKAINQFLTDVMWDDLDYLFLDLPPGTGDVTLTIAQAIPSAEMLVVTTPQVTATNVAGRVAKLAERTKLRVIGVVENMAYYDNNGVRDYIFGKDGGQELAQRLGVPLLGQVPLMKSIREGADFGQPVAISGTPEQIDLFAKMAQLIDDMNPR
jgi:ATP-binding protein involved in chromosome partitioning